MVIVTKNQYILCKKVYDIILDDGVEVIESRKNGKWHSQHIRMHQITVRYEPDNANNHGNVMEATIKLYNGKESKEIFRDLVRQIREQNPDQVYLDKALEELFAQGSVEVDSKKDSYALDLLEDISVTRAKKPSKARKAKRRR